MQDLIRRWKNIFTVTSTLKPDANFKKTKSKQSTNPLTRQSEQIS